MGNKLKKNKFYRVFLPFSILLIISCLAVFSYDFFKNPILKKGVPSEVILVKTGDRVKEISIALHQKKLINRPFLFALMTRLSGQAKKLQAGAYEITPGMTQYDFLNHLSHGQVMKYYIQFIEGWTFSQFINVLHSDNNLKHELDYGNKQQLMLQLKY